MAVSLAELARLVNGQLNGNGSIPITGADIIRDVRPGDITFAEHDRLADELKSCAAAAVVTSAGFRPVGIAFITVDDVQEAFAKIVRHFRPAPCTRPVGVSPHAMVSPTAQLGADVTIYPGAVVGDDVMIGSGATIHASAQVMAGCHIGENSVLFPGAVLYENTVVGRRCLIHSGAVIGAYGFGYNTVAGCHQLSAQLGSVQIGDDVDIGACTTIDRSTYGVTVIGDGTKIDNQVMIAHNCRIGRHNVICSQVGIAGSTTTGDYVVMAGQVGVRDHVHIGTGAKLGAKAGVMSDIPDGGTYVGIPATPERKQMVMQAAMMKLPELKKQLRALQRAVAELEKNGDSPTRQEAA